MQETKQRRAHIREYRVKFQLATGEIRTIRTWDWTKEDIRAEYKTQGKILEIVRL